MVHLDTHYKRWALYAQTEGKALPQVDYKIISAMLYTRMRCLQVMYVISHVCVADLG